MESFNHFLNELSSKWKCQQMNRFVAKMSPEKDQLVPTAKRPGGAVPGCVV